MPQDMPMPTNPWGTLTPRSGAVELVLDAVTAADDPMQNLSAAVRSNATLFLGSDEGVSIERLERVGDRWARHRRLSLADYLTLATAEEADIEGLAEDDGWLWVLGSHARTRPKIKGDEDCIDIDAFRNLKDTRPRCLLARLPLIDDPDAPGVLLPAARDGIRRAGLLKQTAQGNALATALARDPLLKAFARIPAKEGGVDLEGIAVAGSRVALGMRGPVLQGYAVLLEMEVAAKRSGRLKLVQPPLKRLLDLDGLGIRDLKRHGDDLLVLAGPTTGLDGPCAVYRWRGWLHDAAKHDGMVRRHRPERIIDLPFGRGEEHPEGLALLPGADGRDALLVVCDGPSAARIDVARHALACDLYSLPG